MSVVPHYYVHAVPGAEFGSYGVEQLNIFEGDTADLYALFYGVKPFEFSYSRVAVDGQQEIRHIEQVDDYSYKLTTGREGVYKLLAVKDKYCSYSVN